MITKLRGPDINIEMDTNEIFPNDPGQGVPVLVVLGNDEASASWNCATSEREVEGTKLTNEQEEWLESMRPRVEQWLRVNSV